MHSTLLRAAALSLLVALCGAGTGALAQAPARAPQPGSASPPPPSSAAPSAAAPRPDRTTASYGDWILRCELQASAGGRRCEIAHTVTDQRGQTLALLVARRAAPTGPVLLTAQVGTNVTVTEPLRLSVDEQAGVTLPFRRCVARGCFAESQLSDAELGALSRGEAARMEFRDADGQAVGLSASLRGLAPSLEALRTAD
jgi:invasion protein IalB